MGFFYVWVGVRLVCVQPKRPRYMTRLLVLLLVMLVVAVPTAYLVAPHFRRWQHIRWLTSTDPDKRQRGLMYVSVRAGDDDGVLMGAVDRLGVQEDNVFLRIVWALQSAGCWQRDLIPDGAWLRWIMLHAHEPGIEAPAMAAQRLAQMQDLADDPRLTSLLRELSNHSEPDVRYNALCAAAELFMSVTDKPPYHDLITDLLNDTEPVIVQHAEYFAYLTGIPKSDTPTWLKDSRDSQADTRYDSPAILALLFSKDAPLRDVGCVLAVRDLEQSDIADLISDLLRDSNDGAKMSGAILAGMTGLHTDLLHQQIVNQTDWVTASVMKLGLWMHRDDMAGVVQPEALLAHGDVPRTTIILAMLHRRDAQGLEVLLNPRGEVPDDLAILLENYGWWRVLDRYLPEDAPRWQSGIDPAEQQSQIDLLRDWYLVNRHWLMNRPTATDEESINAP